MTLAAPCHRGLFCPQLRVTTPTQCVELRFDAGAQRRAFQVAAFASLRRTGLRPVVVAIEAIDRAMIGVREGGRRDLRAATRDYEPGCSEDDGQDG